MHDSYLKMILAVTSFVVKPVYKKYKVCTKPQVRKQLILANSYLCAPNIAQHHALGKGHPFNSMLVVVLAVLT